MANQNDDDLKGATPIQPTSPAIDSAVPPAGAEDEEQSGVPRRGTLNNVKDWYTNPRSRVVAIAVTATLAAVVGYGLIDTLSGPSHALPASSVIEAKNLTTPGGPGTPAYEKMLKHANVKQANAAAKAGNTFMPTPVALQVTPKPKPAAPVAVAVSTPVLAPAPVVRNPYGPQPTSAQQNANNVNSAMEKDIEVELKNMVNVPVKMPHVIEVSAAGTTTGAGAAGASGTKSTQASTTLALAGHISFAMLDISVNSNNKGPIKATMEGGRFHGARLLGGFKREHQVVLLQFNIMTFNGQSYPIKAYAISAKNAHVGMATSVNNHVLYRYGWLFGAAFLQGIDQALQSTNSTMTMGNGFAVMSHQLNNGQILAQGVANIGNAIEPIMANRFNTPPTVRVKAGTGMGILFMKPVMQK
jgi:intracellular multiplication protein IcmE